MRVFETLSNSFNTFSLVFSCVGVSSPVYVCHLISSTPSSASSIAFFPMLQNHKPCMVSVLLSEVKLLIQKSFSFRSIIHVFFLYEQRHREYKVTPTSPKFSVHEQILKLRSFTSERSEKPSNQGPQRLMFRTSQNRSKHTSTSEEQLPAFKTPRRTTELAIILCNEGV